MTREEFSARLKELRKESGVLLRHIYAKMDVNPTIVTRIENAQGNYTLKRALSLINAINAELYIYNPGENSGQLIESDMQALGVIEGYIKASSATTVAKNIGITKSAIYHVRAGRASLTIDVFLKTSKFFNLKVVILRK